MNTLLDLAVPIAALIAVVATAPTSAGRRRREAARRRRPVIRHSAFVNLDDVRRRLDAELPVRHTEFVKARIARHRIDARTLWTWLDRHGAEALVLALASGEGYAGILRILRDEKPYDAEQASLLARLSEPELFAVRVVA